MIESELALAIVTPLLAIALVTVAYLWRSVAKIATKKSKTSRSNNWA